MARAPEPARAVERGSGSAWFELGVSAGRTRTGAAVAQVLRQWPGGRLRVSGIHPAQLLASCLQDGG
jgi:hypothetical protein